MKTNLKKLPKSRLEVDFELNAEEFGKHVDRALLRFKDTIRVDGFRPGQAPLKMVESMVKEENLLMEAGDMAARESYTRFVNEQGLEPIGQPEVQIVKIAKGSPFLFKVTVGILPEVSLPDYRAIASQVKKKEVLVDETEVKDALRYLQKSRAKFSQVDRGAQKGDFVEIRYRNEYINGGQEVKDGFVLGEGGFLPDFEENLVGMESGQKKEFTAIFPDNAPQKNLAGKESLFAVTMVSVQKMEIPDIDEAFVKSLGAFDGIGSLKKSVREGILAEKELSEKNRLRTEIINAISQGANLELPESMVRHEQARMCEELKYRIESSGKITFSDYLASVKKTEEEIRDSFLVDAEKRIKNMLVLREIGKRENVVVSRQEIEDEINKMILHYPKEQVDKIDIGRLKEYTEDTIYNEKVFQSLEKLFH